MGRDKEVRVNKNTESLWMGGGLFEHRPEGSVVYETDGPATGEPGYQLRAAKPMEVLIGALTGCTGVDLVSILTKMRVELRSLRIEASTERAEELPRIYSRIHLDYWLETAQPEMRKVKRALWLSTNKYCSVSAMLGHSAEITYTLHYQDETHSGVMHDAG